MSNTQKTLWLTKTLFQKGLVCPRKVVYSGRYPERASGAFVQNLAEDGYKINQYARLLYPRGMEIAYHGNNLEEAVQETERLLWHHDQNGNNNNNNNSSITLWEGAIRHDNCLIRADILHKEYKPDSQQGSVTLHLMEVKAKSYDSRLGRSSIQTNKGQAKSTFLPYLRDLAFQTYVVQEAYPHVEVIPYLVLPDKAQINHVPDLYNRIHADMTEEEIQRIREEHAQNQSNSTTITTTTTEPQLLVSAIELADMVQNIIKNDKITLMGVSRSFADCIKYLAELQSMPEEASQLDMTSPVPLSTACKECEFRLAPYTSPMMAAVAHTSGFTKCWTGASQKGLPSGTDKIDGYDKFVIDLYSGGSTVTKLLQEQRYTFQDVKQAHVGVDKTGTDPTKKNSGLSRKERQWFHASQKPDVYYDFQLWDHHFNSSWQFPYHFVDFESIAPALPFTTGKRPYEALAFQFSHHILYEDGTFEHANEFLHIQHGVCPNVKFLDALVDSLSESKGTIFRWGVHEKTILQALLSSIEVSSGASYANREFVERLLIGGDRAMVDLMEAVHRGYYVPGSGASSSLKNVLLPTLRVSNELRAIYSPATYNSRNFTNMQWWQETVAGSGPMDPYKLLSSDEATASSTVAHGGDAIVAYKLLHQALVDDEQRAAIERSLRRYCELDTLAMMMIVQAMQGMLRNGVPTFQV